ncbi:type II secretion system minor pseudopilin GspK [Azonexus sp.]|uniref:type II secretion system minor pseudopilin GspK n=1 Tax=Azonexus sp. TaxID=1872668 RepID=UPI0035B2D521
MSPPPIDRSRKWPCRGRRPQRGAAVITALLVVALAATTAALLLGRLSAWTDHVAVARDKAQATELARAGIDYARALLAADAARSATDDLSEDWARELPTLHHESAEIGGRIRDAQGRFNLNNLRRDDGGVDEQALAAYRRLLAGAGLPGELADRLADWLDADDSRRADGAEAADYAPGAATGSGRPLDDFPGLLRVAGYTPAVVARLNELACVLPGRQPVNVNTAPAEVLSAIQPGLTLAAARELAAARRALPFRDVADFRQRIGDPGLPAALLPVAAASRHFLVDIEVHRGAARSRVASLVQRRTDGGSPRILWQNIQ